MQADSDFHRPKEISFERWLWLTRQWDRRFTAADEGRPTDRPQPKRSRAPSAAASSATAAFRPPR